MQKNLSKTDLAWAAGFIDGEGYIGIRPVKSSPDTKGNPHLQLRIIVSNTRPLAILKLVSMFGGDSWIRPPAKAGHRTQYVWQVFSRAAEDVLKEIQPYLVIKSEQADTALSYRATYPSGEYPLTDDLVAHRGRLMTHMNVLNNPPMDSSGNLLD